MKFRDYFSLKHLIFAIILMAIMLCFAIHQSNNTVKVSFANDHVYVRSSKYGMTISYQDIDSVALEALGNPGEKADEEAWDDDIVRYGNWINDDWGKYIACIDPDTSNCIVVHISDGRTLVFSRKNDATTQEIYDTLLTYLPNE